MKNNQPVATCCATEHNDRNIQLSAIRKLDEVLSDHLRWLNQFNKVLVCGAGPESDLTTQDGYQHCQFGRWYDDLDISFRRRWLSYLKRVSATHEEMHSLGKALVTGRQDGFVDGGEYERFTNAARIFETSLRALQFRLVQDVCLIDHLTGAWNRSSLFQRLNAEYDRMLRHGDRGCLCMMDLDHFKDVNDQYGHTAGDYVLQCVVDIAKASLRRYDSIFRFGGEEFLLCLPRVAVREAVLAMERVRMDIATTPVRLRDGQEITITASFGIAEFSPVLSVEENVEVADRALFSAKAGGRNQVVWINDGCNNAR